MTEGESEPITGSPPFFCVLLSFNVDFYRARSAICSADNRHPKRRPLHDCRRPTSGIYPLIDLENRRFAGGVSLL